MISLVCGADGDTLTVTGFSGGTHGSLVLNPDGSYNYTVTDLTGLNGSHLHDVFTYAISDGHGGVAAANLDIELNRGPSAANDSGAVTQGASLAVTAGSGVLTNDSDSDADALSVTGFTGAGGTGTIGGALPGAWAALVLNVDSSFSYTPNAVKLA